MQCSLLPDGGGTTEPREGMVALPSGAPHHRAQERAGSLPVPESELFGCPLSRGLAREDTPPAIQAEIGWRLRLRDRLGKLRAD